MPNFGVGFVRKEVVKARKDWELIEDCIAGEQQIKYRREKYLPRPNATDTSVENTARYESYLARAVFYNVTRRTMFGMVGQVFSRDPEHKMSERLRKAVWEDATGLGTSLVQLAKLAVEQTTGYGRIGLFVDYPNVTTDGVTESEMRELDLRPHIRVVSGKHIINWRTKAIKGKQKLTLVVFIETVEEESDKEGDFTTTEIEQFRVLRLVNGVYINQVYANPKNPGAMLNRPLSTYVPLDADGNTFDEIPFKFVGSVDNDASIDPAPLYDIASLNIGHYRNSADYEDACYMRGQPSFVFGGLSKDWVNNVWGGKIYMGSRAAITLPVGGTFGLLQAEANSMPYEAMKQKEEQMVALGARLVESTAGGRSATEALSDQATEKSTLGTIASNVSDGFGWALYWCGRFLGSGDDSPEFKLHTEFDLTKLTPEERRMIIEEWVKGAIALSEMRKNLKRAGIASLSDDDYKKELETNPPPEERRIAAEEKKAEQQTAPNQRPSLGTGDNGQNSPASQSRPLGA